MKSLKIFDYLTLEQSETDRLCASVSKLIDEASASIEYFNLKENPDAISADPIVEKMIARRGIGCAPVTTLDGITILTGRYPTNKELVRWLEADPVILGITGPIDEGGCDPAGNCATCGRCGSK